jgi:acetyl esterase/lipase
MLLVLSVVSFLADSAWLAAAEVGGYKRTEDVTYARKFGTALTFDVFEPEKKNGAAVFFMVSGGFVSNHDHLNPKMLHPLLERGDNQAGIGKVGTQFKGAFGPRSETAESRKEPGKEVSPINFVTSNMAPTLILHGDADKLVPIYQAQIFEKKCREAGATFRLITKAGADHGWTGMEKDIAIFDDWFDEHLRGKKRKE